MNWIGRISRRIRALFRRRQQLEAEMEEEIELHIQLKIQANLNTGMTPNQARASALRDFGWAESIKDKASNQSGPDPRAPISIDL